MGARIEKIACLLPVRAQYGVVDDFARGWVRALRRLGVRVSLADPSELGNFQQIVQWTNKQKADCVIGFNSFMTSTGGQALTQECDVPFLAYLVDAPHNYMPFEGLSKLMLACVDGDDALFFREQLGFQRACFVPHAAEIEECLKPREAPEYDLVFFGTWMNPQVIRKRWQAHSEPSMARWMDEACDRVLTDRSLCTSRVLLEGLEAVAIPGIETVNTEGFATAWHLVDLYLRAHDRLELLRSLDTHRIELFGNGLDEGSWLAEAGISLDHIRVNAAVEYADALSIMRRSKVVLNNFPTFHKGAHERVFNGLAAGALVVTNRTEYVGEHFQDDQELVIYDPSNLEDLSDRISLYLHNDERRSQVAEAGRELVRTKHTWDSRMPVVLEAASVWLREMTEEL